MKSFLSWTTIVIVGLLLFVGCKEDKEITRTILLSPTEKTVPCGRFIYLNVKVIPPLPIGEKLTWTSSDENIATVNNGAIKTHNVGTAIISASYEDISASVTAIVEAIPAKSITLNTHAINLMLENTFQLTAKVEPKSTTYPQVTFTSENPEIATVDKNGLIKAVGIGVTCIKAKIGELEEKCDVYVCSPAKIGDYFYADGTWSDGGLLEIDEDGQNAVWATDKPAPIKGKKVIGIIFQTNEDRISKTEKELGFINGYVIGTHNIHKPDKKTTWFTADEEYSCIPITKSGESWYKNIEGYTESKISREKYANNFEALTIYFNLENYYTDKAPKNTSGWYIPSTGQLWDCLSNLLGSEVAAAMKEWRTSYYDATYYSNATFTFNPLDKFNSVFEKIDEKDKDLLEKESEKRKHAYLWTSSRYDNESIDAFLIGDYFGKLEIECSCNWYNGDCSARPILAF